MGVSVKARNFQISPSEIDLNSQDVRLSKIDLSGVSGSVKMGVSQKDSIPSDTAGVRWRISAEKLSLSDISLDLSLSEPETDISAILEKAEVDGCHIDLGNRQVNVSGIDLSSGRYSYLYTPPVQKEPEEEKVVEDTISFGKEWTISTGHISIRDNQFLYGNRDVEPMTAFNPEYIEISHIGVEIDTLYNRGSSVYAKISQVQAAERSGLAIRALSGIFSMENGAIRIPKANIRTSRSQLSLSADISSAFFSQQKEAPVFAELSGHLDFSEFSPVLDSLFIQHKELEPKYRENFPGHGNE